MKIFSRALVLFVLAPWFYCWAKLIEFTVSSFSLYLIAYGIFGVINYILCGILAAFMLSSFAIGQTICSMFLRAFKKE